MQDDDIAQNDSIDLDVDDDAAAAAFLKKAAETSGNLSEVGKIQPIEDQQPKTDENVSKDANWVDLMPALPGSMVNPAVTAEQEKVDLAVNSPVRGPGYDNITQEQEQEQEQEQDQDQEQEEQEQEQEQDQDPILDIPTYQGPEEAKAQPISSNDNADDREVDENSAETAQDLDIEQSESNEF